MCVEHLLQTSRKLLYYLICRCRQKTLRSAVPWDSVLKCLGWEAGNGKGIDGCTNGVKSKAERMAENASAS